MIVNVLHLILAIVVYFICIHNNILTMDNSADFEDLKKKLEWGECNILQEEHPWKGFFVQKRIHPFLYHNQSIEMLNERKYQYKLCQCSQKINNQIKLQSVINKTILIVFNRLVIVDSIHFTASWHDPNSKDAKMYLFTEVGNVSYYHGDYYRKLSADRHVAKWRLFTRLYTDNIQIKFEDLNIKKNSVNISIYGCPLVCGDMKIKVTDIIYHVNLKMDIPSDCLWHIKPIRSSSVVLNLLDRDIDCDSSDIIIADGSKPFSELRNSWIGSLCQISSKMIDNLLYNSLWLYYISGTSTKTIVEHFSLIYYGGCDRQFILSESEGIVNVSIHGASDIQKMKFDCSIYIKRSDKLPFLISFQHFELFSLTKSSCTSNYIMIYSGNSAINNIPFCDSIIPPKYIDARFGWLRLKIVNSAPIYDINMVIYYKILSHNDSNLFNITNMVNEENFDQSATIIVFYTFIACLAILIFVVITHSWIENILSILLTKKIKVRKVEEIQLLENT